MDFVCKQLQTKKHHQNQDTVEVLLLAPVETLLLIPVGMLLLALLEALRRVREVSEQLQLLLQVMICFVHTNKFLY
ncbi:unnamed protein product [Gongylonema pulchrum]|uniref:Ovule protein n=1 Tax=Gongylonema pulchrum TaxID=637853 RepID=A0A183D8R8_9BILA|nr:unnamed protein product [Gongylonema pulchrum]